MQSIAPTRAEVLTAGSPIASRCRPISSAARTSRAPGSGRGRATAPGQATPLRWSLAAKADPARRPRHRARHGRHLPRHPRPADGSTEPCSRSASSPASTSRTAASSRASTSSTCRTPAIPSRRPPPTTRPAPTSCASSTSRPATRTATPSSTSSSAPPSAASCRSPSAAACAPPRTSASCCKPAPTRSRSTPPPCTAAQFVAEGADKFGAQCIVVAIDAKKVSQPGEPPRWEIFTHGGRKPTGLDAIAYAREVVALGAGEILLTSMDRDGTKAGFDLELTRAIADAVSVPVIASGGVGTLDHLVEGVRKRPCQRRAGRLDLPLRHVHASARPSATWRPPASPMRLDAAAQPDAPTACDRRRLRASARDSGTGKRISAPCGRLDGGRVQRRQPSRRAPCVQAAPSFALVLQWTRNRLCVEALAIPISMAVRHIEEASAMTPSGNASATKVPGILCPPHFFGLIFAEHAGRRGDDT